MTALLNSRMHLGEKAEVLDILRAVPRLWGFAVHVELPETATQEPAPPGEPRARREARVFVHWRGDLRELGPATALSAGEHLDAVTVSEFGDGAGYRRDCEEARQLLGAGGRALGRWMGEGEGAAPSWGWSWFYRTPFSGMRERLLRPARCQERQTTPASHMLVLRDAFGVEDAIGGTGGVSHSAWFSCLFYRGPNVGLLWWR